MNKNSTRKTKFILLIIFIFLIAIVLSVFLIKSNTGDAKAIMNLDKELEQITSVNNSLSSQKLTEFNIPTKEPLETTSISQTFKENTTFDLKLEKPIIALSVTGNATLLSEAGLVRIVLVDSEKHEYLVYEIDSLLVNNSKNIDFENVCEETCVFDKAITPVSIKVQIEDAVLNLSEIQNLSADKSFTEVKTDLKNHKQEIFKSQNQAKIEKYNSAQKSWTAGETSVSNLSYENKKKLFAREDGTTQEYLPNLQGFLNYKGGIFTLSETKEQQAKAQDNITPDTPPELEQNNIILPNSWDWRNRHGQNWMTPVKNQGSVGSCMFFTATGAFESQINLYFNQHLNLDLSEQMNIDCPGRCYPNSECNNCYYSLTGPLCKIKSQGVADETCDIYRNIENNSDVDYCSNNYICADWGEKLWRISEINSYLPNFDENYISHFPLTEQQIKAKIITSGPVYAATFSSMHAMVLMGYKYNSNWTIEEQCVNNAAFCTNGGCESIYCSDSELGNTKSVCITNVRSNDDIDFSVYNYNCEFIDNQYRWKYQEETRCDQNQICINGSCQIANLEENYASCGYLFFHTWYNYLTDTKLKYSHNNRQIVWLFKNSWGSDWGENGYVNVATSSNDFIEIAEFSENIVPPINQSYWPAGFNNTINCVDEDGDSYCNWGISEEKPSTCPSFCKPRKDCDDSNPDLLDFISETNLNCRYKYTIER